MENEKSDLQKQLRETEENLYKNEESLNEMRKMLTTSQTDLTESQQTIDTLKNQLHMLKDQPQTVSKPFRFIVSLKHLHLIFLPFEQPANSSGNFMFFIPCSRRSGVGLCCRLGCPAVCLSVRISSPKQILGFCRLTSISVPPGWITHFPLTHLCPWPKKIFLPNIGPQLITKVFKFLVDCTLVYFQ